MLSLTDRRGLPNALTVGRLILGAACLGMLAVYRFPDTRLWALVAAFALFILAAVTDWLDGHLARRWNAQSVFGRIMDPLADKVLVLGAFIMLAGPNFSDAAGRSASGVLPWMAVVILARELLVTSLRAEAESRGVDFSANWAGKAKMIAQSFAIPLILLLLMLGLLVGSRSLAGVWYTPPVLPEWAMIGVRAVAWTTVVITVASAWPYAAQASRALRPKG
ncbi:MAG: CDP-diacylglycerol--glycerol-3-phosphate 3-phosphatidyltransferase [Phycisphaerales bacterium]|nr:CDP-diacylglycerol--glycerol-3-phosphate 3-phosphatidyltransferase [Phycisphaerales bacterium]